MFGMIHVETTAASPRHVMFCLHATNSGIPFAYTANLTPWIQPLALIQAVISRHFHLTLRLPSVCSHISPTVAVSWHVENLV